MLLRCRVDLTNGIGTGMPAKQNAFMPINTGRGTTEGFTTGRPFGLTFNRQGYLFDVLQCHGQRRAREMFTHDG